MLANKREHHANKHKENFNSSPKKCFRRYKVTPQTAYHITEIALREGIPEGRVIDKIMRTYLATQ